MLRLSIRPLEVFPTKAGPFGPVRQAFQPDRLRKAAALWTTRHSKNLQSYGRPSSCGQPGRCGKLRSNATGDPASPVQARRPKIFNAPYLRCKISDKSFEFGLLAQVLKVWIHSKKGQHSKPVSTPCSSHAIA